MYLHGSYGIKEMKYKAKDIIFSYYSLTCAQKSGIRADIWPDIQYRTKYQTQYPDFAGYLDNKINCVNQRLRPELRVGISGHADGKLACVEILH